MVGWLALNFQEACVFFRPVLFRQDLYQHSIALHSIAKEK